MAFIGTGVAVTNGRSASYGADGITTSSCDSGKADAEAVSGVKVGAEGGGKLGVD